MAKKLAAAANSNGSANANAANSRSKNANANASGSNSRNAPSGANSGNAAAAARAGRNARPEREPIPEDAFKCMVNYYDKYRSDCDKKRETCPLFQQCKDYGVGTSLWPLTKYRISREEQAAIVDSEAYREYVNNGMAFDFKRGSRCMNDTMWNDPNFRAGFREHHKSECPNEAFVGNMIDRREERMLMQQQQQQQGQAAAQSSLWARTAAPKKKLVKAKAAAAPKKPKAAPKKKRA